MANIEPQTYLTRERLTQIVEVCFPPDPLATPAALSEIREGFEGDGEAYRRAFGSHLSCGAAVLIAAWGRYRQWREFTCPGYPSDPHPPSAATCPQPLCGARP